MDDFINIHTHRPGQGLNITDPCLGNLVLPENGTVLYSLGLHPMFLDADAPRRLERVEEAARSGRIVAVGEAGLDRNAGTEMSVQLFWLERQVELASRYGLPLIIHGVRAMPELISLCKRTGAGKGWIIHGFNNRREILEDLLRHGFYISAGRHVMEEGSHIYRLLPEIPADRLFLETDDSGFTIGEIYARTAMRRGISCGELQRMVRRNYEHLFGTRNGRREE